MDAAALVKLAQPLTSAGDPQADAEAQLHAVLDVIWSKRRSFYERALAVRAMGALLQRAPFLMDCVGRMRDDILDALVEIADVCQHAEVPTADSRKVLTPPQSP